MLDSLDALIAFVTVILALSLLVTTLVQIVLNVANMRGRQLQRALCEMFAQMPLPAEVLQGVERGSKRWHKLHATIAKRLVELPALGGGARVFGKRTAALDLTLVPLVLGDLAADLEKDEKSSSELSGLRELAAAIQEKLAAELKDGAKLAHELQTGSLLEKAAQAKDELQSEMVRYLRQKKDRATARFDSFMSIAGERFRMHAHLIGFGMAVALCCYLRVDSFQILREFHAQPEAARAYVEAQTEGLLRMQQDGLAVDALQAVNRDMPERLQEAWKTAGREEAFPPLSQAVPPQSSVWMRSDWSSWIRRQKGLEAEQRKELERTLDHVYADHQRDLEQQSRELREVIGAAPVRVMQPADSLSAWGESFSLNALLGWLFSAFLVALGAPFWFNVLRQLTSLRSTLANAVDEPKPGKKKGGQAPEAPAR